MTRGHTNYLGAALLAATTLVVAACGGGKKSSDTPMEPVNTAPVIASIPDVSVDQDTVVGPIEFGIGDRESGAGALKLTASVDAADVFPADTLVLGGSGPKRSVTLTPLEAATGNATVTLTATDPGGVVTVRTFRVTVNARGASMRDTALTTFAKAEGDAPTAVNGFTFAQDADDPATFAALIGAE